MADKMTDQQPINENWSNENRSLARRNEAQYGVSRYGMSSPFELMRKFTEDVDKMFNAFSFGNLGNLGWPFDQRQMTPWSGTASTMGWTPSVDIITKGDDLIVTADLPGVKPEDVQIEADDSSLIIRGESRNERQRDEQGYFYSERSYGTFYRRLPLPPGVNANNANAQFNNGVLEITLPGAVKQLRPERRHIPIQGTSTQQQPTTNTTSQPYMGTQTHTSTE